MPQKRYHKLGIAVQYLEVASGLYFKGLHLPALSLAAMAEELFEAVMLARNAANRAKSRVQDVQLTRAKYVPISREFVAFMRELNPSLNAVSDAEVYAILYEVKNSAKHGTGKDRKTADLELNVDAGTTASLALLLAIENLVRLGIKPKGATLKLYQRLSSSGWNL